MASRLELHDMLKALGPNVYFQPPSTVTIEYPAIVYSRKSIEQLKANNTTHKENRSYDVKVIDRNPDSVIVDKLARLQYCKYDRDFISDGLNHSAFTLYY